jgi:hypothetical protein
MIPVPHTLYWPVCAVVINNVNGANLIEASKLTGPSWSSLEPDDEWYSIVLPAEVISLPEGVIHGCRLVLIVPINVFISGIGLAGHGCIEFLVEEGGGVFKASAVGEG